MDTVKIGDDGTSQAADKLAQAYLEIARTTDAQFSAQLTMAASQVWATLSVARAIEERK